MADMEFFELLGTGNVVRWLWGFTRSRQVMDGNSRLGLESFVENVIWRRKLSGYVQCRHV
jgi:hypothetical protein